MNRTVNISELMIDEPLKNYIETGILPLYDGFDATCMRNMPMAAISAYGLRTARTWTVSTSYAKLSRAGR